MTVKRSIYGASPVELARMGETIEVGGTALAKVVRYGGGEFVTHWQLVVKGKFIADTSVSEEAELYRFVVSQINAAANT